MEGVFVDGDDDDRRRWGPLTAQLEEAVRVTMARAAAPPVMRVRGLGSSANGILLTIRPSRVTRGDG